MTISLKKTLISVVFTALISTPAFANQTVDVSMTGVPCRDGAMGYSAGVVCAIIDKRQEGVFLTEYQDTVRNAAWVTLRAFHALRQFPL